MVPVEEEEGCHCKIIRKAKGMVKGMDHRKVGEAGHRRSSSRICNIGDRREGEERRGKLEYDAG